MIRGESFTIAMVFNAEYDIETRIQDVTLSVGNITLCQLSDDTIIKSTANTLMCYISSQNTSYLQVGERAITMALTDSVNGVRKAIVAVVPVQNSGNIFENEVNNESANLVLSVTYDITNIVSDLIIADIYMGAGLPHGGVEGQHIRKVSSTNYDVEWSNQLDDITTQSFNPNVAGDPSAYVRKWDATEGTFVFGLPDGGIIQEGKELFDYYVNADTVPLVNGDIVSIVPIAGNRKAIARTNVTNQKSAHNVIGMVTVPTIAVGATGRVTKFGEVHNLLTSLYPDGTELFVSESNPGKWATVGATPPNYTVRIGTVIVSQNGNGIVELGIQCFPKLGDLSDVNGVSSSVNKPIVRKADGVIDAIDNLTLASFAKTGSSDAEVLLGGGGSKTLQSIYDTSAGVVAQYAGEAEQAVIDAEAALLSAQNAQDAAEAAQLAAEQAEATALANNELLGGIAYNASAPTPDKSGKYSFTTGGTCTWLTGGAATVAVGDEVVVVFTAPSTYTYTKVGRPDTEQTRSQSTSKVPSSKLLDDELTNKEDSFYKIIDTATADNLNKCNAIKKAISGVYLYGSGIDRTNYLYSIVVFTNTATNRRIRIFKRHKTTLVNSEVCRLDIVQTSIKTDAELVSIPEHSTSGINAYVLVDWSMLQGIDYLNLYGDIWYLTDRAFNKSEFYVVANISVGNIDNLNYNKTDSDFTILTNISASDLTKAIAIKKAIKSIYCNFEKEAGTEYSISVFTNNSTQRRIRIFQRISSVNTEICRLVVPQSAAATHTETVIIPAQGTSKKNAIVTVDWSKLQNVDYFGSLYPDSWILADKCFSLSNLAKLEYTKRTENLLDGINNLTLTNWLLVGSVIQSQATGWSSYAYFNRNLNEDKFSLSAKISAINAGDFEIGIGKRADISGAVVTLRKNATGSYLCFWKMTTQTAPVEEVALRQTLSSALENNKEYLLKMTKNVNQLTIDLIYPDGTVYQYTTSALGFFSWGYPSIYCITGQCSASNLYFSMPYVRNRDPKLLIFGDSFIEGNSISSQKELRYANLLANDLGQDECILMGKGGESTSTVLDRFYQQANWYQDAKYCLLALGTNDTVFATAQSNLLAMIAYLDTFNITPILVTCTYRSDTNNAAFQTEFNAWVRSSGYKYVDMSLAVTEPGNETIWRSGFQLGDGVHPSITGHEYMYRRIKYDAQYLFK